METKKMEVKMGWGSDAIAELLRKMNFKYAALVPGASYRGLHDSIVNYLGNENPQMLLCLHEEHAVAIAHGYAKVTEEPMLAIVHSNVGLMHATMAFFDAWCDRMPVVVLGATGPVDAMKRRPWIDWIHTSADQGALVRNYTKWDDQPGSPAAALESILRANQISRTLPYGPTYINLDVWLQEEALPAPLPMPELARYKAPEAPVPAPADVQKVLTLLREAKHPLILIGRVARSLEAWNDRIALAEAFNARVITEPKAGAVFPNVHPLFVGPLFAGPSHKAIAPVIREADVILSLSSMDLAGIFKSAYGAERIGATVISASLDRYLHNGWSMDHQGLPPVDLDLAVDPDLLAKALTEAAREKKVHANGAHANGVQKERPSANGAKPGDPIGMNAFSAGVTGAFAGREVTYIRLPRGVKGADFDFRHPLDYLGGDGGGGVGSGPGISVGAALALRGTGRLPVAVLGDGDYLMGVTALWTAVQNKIPLLVVIANNRSYFNDEVHQEHIARKRGRDPERRWIGMRLDDPPPDLAMLARGQGAIGIGPVTEADALGPALADALRAVEAGKVAVVDVVIMTDYDAGVTGVPVIHERTGPERG
jgi:thiamine pyrophosphate-dependent acetolactate synthase large subunit-like protein